MTGPLTTNDVRVLRHLLDHGPHTRPELHAQLGPDADHRIAGLYIRGLITDPSDQPADITTEGVRALRAADRTAYGAYA